MCYLPRGGGGRGDAALGVSATILFQCCFGDLGSKVIPDVAIWLTTAPSCSRDTFVKQ